MERAIITINESGYVNIPDGDVWMPEMKLVELFGVIAPTLRATIRAIYKSGHLTLQQLNDAILPLLKVRLHSTILK